jgi:hypothetical protein
MLLLDAAASVESPLAAVIDGQQSAAIGEDSAYFVFHSRAERFCLQIERPEHRLVP